MVSNQAYLRIANQNLRKIVRPIWVEDEIDDCRFCSISFYLSSKPFVDPK
jgi:hypothetical protein